MALGYKWVRQKPQWVILEELRKFLFNAIKKWEGIFYLEAYLKDRPHMSRVSWIALPSEVQKNIYTDTVSLSSWKRPHTWPDSPLHSNKCLSHCLPLLRPPDYTPILTFRSPLCLYSFANWNTFLCFFYVWTLGKPSCRALVHPHKKQFNWGDVMTQQDTRLEARLTKYGHRMLGRWHNCEASSLPVRKPILSNVVYICC